MIGYVSVGTNDIKRAAAYYDKLMAELGARRIMDFGTFIAWSAGRDKPGFALAQPHDKKPATVGNGVMIAFAVDDPATVDALYKKAIELGGTDEGPPGDRGDNYYGAYFRDLDGNKLNFHCWT
jgi:catechol 2,3-dioxygenase-like lactoylglutathione lyase family enzyme